MNGYGSLYHEKLADFPKNLTVFSLNFFLQVNVEKISE